MDVPRLLRLYNPVKSYAWGSPSAIPEFLGEVATGVPQAELWMGAHPSSPSRVVTGRVEVPLDVFVARDPEAILGVDVAARYAGELPFLMKVLAADAPLSLQAHPDRAQARAGFARENGAGIALDVRQRNYRDSNHKPEVLCALTRFDALCGFRTPVEVAGRLAELRARDLQEVIAALGTGGVRGFFRALMNLTEDERGRVLLAARRAAEESPDPSLAWVARLVVDYPGDIGVLSPLFLNLVTLEPGEALYLPARELHGYLGGVGIELMANSDNVLRGGLTSKHVDLTELMATLSFEPRRVVPLRGEGVKKGERHYTTPAEEFALSAVEVSHERGFESPLDHNVEILLCTRGTCHLSDRSGESGLPVQRGDSVFVPASLGGYRVSGDGVLYRAQVGGSVRGIS